MSRPRTLPDDQILECAKALMLRHGPEHLTFASLARESGLSASTLVQRFGNKSALVQAALLRAWDGLERATAERAASVEQSPRGAIDLLVGLSHGYGDIAAYADGLLILREDVRDPVLRARGAAWAKQLFSAIGDCFDDTPDTPPDIGRLMATQWQGALLWWSFEPRGRVSDHVRERLEEFVAAILQNGGPSA